MFFFPITPKGRASRNAAKKLYPQIVARAREAVFYREFGVPDSFTGRFEMVALHVGMVINRLRNDGIDGSRLAQALFDEMVLNMDMSCRQSGIGDLGVPKQLKKMMTALQGRALIYQEAAKAGIESLSAALNKNLYATVERPPENISTAMAQYIVDCNTKLNEQNLTDFADGKIAFASLPYIKGSINEQISQVA